MSSAEPTSPERTQDKASSALRAAVRDARIEAAERTGVVVDLRDAELARLEILNEALGPVFAALPRDLDLFDRGLVPGVTPRLWIDMLAHIGMGTDKRVYRFLQDTRYGRRVLAESTDAEAIVRAVTAYVARRMVERERALTSDSLGDGLPVPGTVPAAKGGAMPQTRKPFSWKAGLLFLAGMAAGALSLLAFAWFVEPLL